MKPHAMLSVIFTLLVTHAALTALQPIKTRGLPDASFNPNGFFIQADGLPTPGGYPGSLIIDLGGDDGAYSVGAVQFASDALGRIILGGDAGTGPDMTNFAVVVLLPNGMPDSTFNPSGLTILSDGTTADLGGYPGSLIIDLGGSDFGRTTSFITDSRGRIIIGGRANTGPSNNNNFAVVVLNPSGAQLLDTSFNPSGFAVTKTGALVNGMGGYPGALIIDLGGNDGANGSDAVQFSADNRDRIILGGRSGTGPGIPGNFVVVTLNVTGVDPLDRSFNPSGLSIDRFGNAGPFGGYAGSLFIDLGGNDQERDLSFLANPEDRIILGGFSTTGPNPGPARNFAVVVVKPDGSLDRSFNPSGKSIAADGSEVAIGGYSGSLLIDLGGSDYGFGVDAVTFSSDSKGRILLGGRTDTGVVLSSDNFALVVLNTSGPDLLDRSFNPEGKSINSAGQAIMAGGYSGSIIIDLGGSDYARSVAFTADTQGRILLGGTSNANDFAVIALDTDGSLDTTFNPQGVAIDNDGSQSAGGSYPGAILVKLGVNSVAFSITSDAQGRIIIGGRSDAQTSDNNFAVVVLNSQTVFPVSVSPLSECFVALAAI